MFWILTAQSLMDITSFNPCNKTVKEVLFLSSEDEEEGDPKE